MQKSFLTPALLASCLVASVVPIRGAEDNSDVIILPLSMTTQVDAGQLMKGNTGSTSGNPSNQDFIQRTSVWLTQEIVIRERLDVKIGVGGLFWYSFPGAEPSSTASSITPFASLTKFGPGISRADMTYRFGEAKAPMFTLQAGFFPYKYNSDAKDLGEYLLRSGTYPGYLVSGGWNLISEAGYMMRGLRLNMALWDGKFQSDFLLPMEQDMRPTGDLSPTYVASVTPVRGVEIGGGVSCSHCIAVNPSKTSPEAKMGSDISRNIGNGNAYIVKNTMYIDTLPTTEITGTNPKYVYDTTGRYYTFQGVKLMGRLSLDPKAYISMPLLGAQDLKVFGEVALLGVKNYPFYYEDVWRRMPVMVGFNLPTFRLLDAFSFQVEYYNSKFPNSIWNVYNYGMPTYDFVDNLGNQNIDPNVFDPNNKVVKRDNWKWAMYARKEIIKGIRLYAQVADDNLRVPDFNVTPGARPVTNIQGKDWYYLVRLELGI